MAGPSSCSSLLSWLFPAAIFTVLLLSVACIVDTPDAATVPAGPSSETPEDVLARVKAGVAELRRLAFLEPVEAEYLSPEEITAYLEDLMREEERQELDQLDEFLSILGLIGPDVDLVDLYLDLLAEGVLGAYDTEDGRLVVRLEADTIGPSQELTLAHELTHALQQQHFDIHSLLEDAEGDFDRGLAVSALAEGDATLLELLYLRSNSLSPPEIPEIPVYDSAPQVVQDLLLFPYTAGLRMLAQNFGDEGWDDINASYQDPPRSTEQVMHPEKYLDAEPPLNIALPDVSPVLGQHWMPIYTSTGGQFLIQNYLDSRLSTREATQAAAGWGGDSFALYGDAGDHRLLLWAFRWDSQDDAEEFFDAHTELLEESREWTDSIQGTGYRVWGSPDQWVHMQVAGDYVGLIISPSELLVTQLAPLFNR